MDGQSPSSEERDHPLPDTAGDAGQADISRLADLGRRGITQLSLSEPAIEKLAAEIGRMAVKMPEAEALTDALYALAYLYPANNVLRKRLGLNMTRLCALADDVLPEMPGFQSIHAASETLKWRVMFRSKMVGMVLQEQIIELRQVWARERALDGYSKSAGESPQFWRDYFKQLSWREYFNQLCRCVRSEQIIPPALTDDDELLIREWSNGDSVSNLYERARLYSARSAEKALEKFYESMGLPVTDVSVEQLSAADSSDWRLGDLRVGDRLIDVKNSRMSLAMRFEDIPNYVEHCVPRFKRWRWGKSVTIAGVLSPYISADAPEKSWSRQIQFLGEISKEKLDSIRNYFCTDDLLVIDFRRPNEQGAFLPPWTFEYPEKFYSTAQAGDSGGMDRPEGKWPSYSHVRAAGFQPLAILATCQESWPDHWARTESDEPTLEFFERLRRASLALGRSRPVIWVAILRFVLELMGKMDRSGDWSPEELFSVIYLRARDTDRPLGLYDPLLTIHSLLTVLDTAWKHLAAGSFGFRQFQVVSGAILRARTDAQFPWTTIVAYCGGWKTYAGPRYPDGDKARCGNTPLYLGRHKTCSGCFHLVCNECGFCSSGCQLLEEHQLKADEQNRPVLDSELEGSEVHSRIETLEDAFDPDIPF